MERFCQNCGSELKGNRSTCPECGRTVTRMYENNTSSHFVIAGFIISICSLVINFGGLVGLTGAILSGISLSKTNSEKEKRFAFIGLIIGIISLLYGLYALLVLIK